MILVESSDLWVVIFSMVMNSSPLCNVIVAQALAPSHQQLVILDEVFQVVPHGVRLMLCGDQR